MKKMMSGILVLMAVVFMVTAAQAVEDLMEGMVRQFPQIRYEWLTDGLLMIKIDASDVGGPESVPMWKQLAENMGSHYAAKKRHGISVEIYYGNGNTVVKARSRYNP